MSSTVDSMPNKVQNKIICQSYILLVEHDASKVDVVCSSEFNCVNL